MKNTKAKLEAIKAAIEEKIEKRQEVFDDRSDDWKESEKGDDYEFKTAELQEVSFSLDTAIDELDTYLDI